MHRTARCCCGQVSIEVEGDPDIHIVCHCNNCKKRTGSAFGISAYFANSKIVNKTGDTNLYVINNDVTTQQRFFCDTCGTTLYWYISKFDSKPTTSEMTGVASGCFIDNPLPAPTVMSFHSGQCSWLDLPDLKKVGPSE